MGGCQEGPHVNKEGCEGGRSQCTALVGVHPAWGVNLSDIGIQMKVVPFTLASLEALYLVQ